MLGGILAEYSFLFCYGASFIIAICALLPVLFMVEVPIEKLEQKGKKIITILVDHFKISASVLKENRNILKVIVFFKAFLPHKRCCSFIVSSTFSIWGTIKFGSACLCLRLV